MIDKSNRKLRWGLLCCGRIANDFTISMGNLAHEHEIIAVADYNLEAAKKFAEKFNIKKAYGSYLEIAQDPDIDIVYVGTRNMHHYAACKLMIEHNKHCIVEKPFTCCPKTGRKLFELAKERNTFLMEALWSNFTPAYTKLRQLLKDGVIGDLVHIQSTYMEDITEERIMYKKFGGGVVLDNGVYTINSILAAVDYQLPTKVKAIGHLYDTTDAECTVTAILDFPNNVTASCIMTGKANHDYIEQINHAFYIGTKGYIKFSAMINCPSYIEVNGERIDTSANDNQTGYNWLNTYGLRYQADEVRKCILNNEITSSIHKPEHTLAISDTLAAIHKEIGMVISPTIDDYDFKNV